MSDIANKFTSFFTHREHDNITCNIHHLRFDTMEALADHMMQSPHYWETGGGFCRECKREVIVIPYKVLFQGWTSETKDCICGDCATKLGVEQNSNIVNQPTE